MSEKQAMKEVRNMAKRMAKLKTEIANREEALKKAKEAYRELERESLPLAMAELGLRTIELESGEVIKITEDVDAKITETTRAGALAWLVDNGYGGLIKTAVSVEFPRDNRTQAIELVKQLSGEYEGVDLDEKVHHSTLKAFVKEQLQKGESIPFDLFNVFPYSKAIVK